MMTQERRDLIERKAVALRAAMEGADRTVRTAFEADVRRLARNSLATTHPDYRAIVALAKLQVQRWDLAELEIKVLEREPVERAVLASPPCLGRFGGVRRVWARCWAIVRRCRR